MADGAGVFLSDDLRERIASLATAQNVTSDALVEPEELCRKLSLQTEKGGPADCRHYQAVLFSTV